jgi:hypothetical protein
MTLAATPSGSSAAGTSTTYAAIGQLNGTHVHKLSGSYVGELYDGMVVDQRLGNFGNIGNPGNPGHPGSPGNPGNRGARGTPYRDVFDQLME